MIKMSWGVKIAILYTGFIGLVVFMVIMSVRQKIDLVSEDYYTKELAYQSKIDEMKNADELTASISHSFTDTDLELQFQPEFKSKTLTGQILFFRPSDSSRDFEIPVSINADGQQKVALNKLSKGMYKMQISWKADNTPYYSEETIVIP